jgi:hypothetical protein
MPHILGLRAHPCCGDAAAASPANLTALSMTRNRVWAAATEANVIPIVLSIGLVIYLYLGVGNGQLLDEDYAVYLQQAWNIAHHQPMTQMGVIQHFDPRLPLIEQSPLIYPPLLPLLYALPVLLVQFDLHVFKVIQLAILLLTFLLFCYAMRKWRFGILEISVSLIVFATAYEVRRAVDTLGSDIPFLLFVVPALLGIDNTISSKDRGRYYWGVAAGAAVFLTVNIRTVGIVLLPSLIAADFLRHRRWRVGTVAVPVATVALLWLCQRVVLGPNQDYAFMFQYRFFDVLGNLREFYWAIAVPLRGSKLFHLELGIFLVLCMLAVLAVAKETMQGGVLAVFTLGYTVLLLILPEFDAGARYLLPQLLVLGAFALRGATIVAAAVTKVNRIRRIAPVAVGAAAVFFAALIPAPLPSGTWNFGATSPPARQVFAFIRDELPADAAVAATKYRSFHLFTRRTTMRMPTAASGEELLDKLRRDGVTAVVVKYSPPGWNYDFTDCPGSPFCRPASLEAQAKQVFRNSDYAVFTIAPAAD